MVSPLFPRNGVAPASGAGARADPASFHRLLHIPRAGAALWRPVLLPAAPAALLFPNWCSPGAAGARRERGHLAGDDGVGLSWHCPKPRSSLLARRWAAGAVPVPGCSVPPPPGRAGSQACAPWEPGGSVTLILALSARPLAGVPLSLSEIPHCLCQTLLVRAAAAGLGRAGSFVEPLPGSRLFTLQPPFPNRSVRSTWLLLVNISLSAVGCCSLGNHSSKARLAARSARGLPAGSHQPL